MPPRKTPFGNPFGTRHPESPLRNPFGTCPTERPPSEPLRSMPCVPKVTPKDNLRFFPLEYALSRSPNESPLRSLLRTYLRRMPRVPSDRPREYSREGCERATCPECRSQDNPPGCRARAPRVPKPTPRAQPGDSPTTLRKLSERDTCPRVP